MGLEDRQGGEVVDGSGALMPAMTVAIKTQAQVGSQTALMHLMGKVPYPVKRLYRRPAYRLAGISWDQDNQRWVLLEVFEAEDAAV